MRRVIPIALVLAVAVGVVFWVRHREAPEPPPPNGPATVRYDQVRADADRLAVTGWDRDADFRRAAFGEPWSDDVDVEFGRNGCNTRDDILRRDLVDLVIRPGTCYAESGTLRDPYGGAVIAFTRGPQTSPAVQIDHVVSLSDAWYKGAREWDDQRRRDFANDPRNLIAVDGEVNFAKAFRDVGSWLPSNVAFRCEFVARVVEVKTAYGLSVSAREKDAVDDVLAGC